MVTPSISFIVPLFNHIEHSKAMLASLQATVPRNLPHEIILVDDGSTDDTRQWLSGLDNPRVRVALNRANLGFARANHAGIAQARGAVLALVNNDLVFRPGWLEPMWDLLHTPAMRVGVVGNVQTRVSDSAVDHAGVSVSGSGKLYHVQQVPDGGLQYGRVFAVTGACCLVTRELFDAVGGFDKTFVNGGEDIDLCLKIAAKGFGIYMAYGSVVEHHVGLTRDRTSLQNEMNSRLLYSKWRPVLKREIAKSWHEILRGGAATAGVGASYRLAPSLVYTPFTAGQVMAESALLREEARWARLLDKVDPNAGLADRCRSAGLRRNEEDSFFELTNPVVRVWIESPNGLNGIYISGKLTRPPEGLQTKITITVNSLQEATFTLTSAGHFNVGISEPAVLPRLTNCVEAVFSTFSPDPATDMYVDPCTFVRIDHLVIDEKKISRLAGA